MFEAHTINADHKDLIHDVAYDFYGERMATCSSDHFVKIWDLDSKGTWQLSASWKAHSGSVWKVTWAHPEFGQVIATSSFDRTAAIWEEVGDSTVPGEKGLRQWIRRTNLVDSRTSVTDIKFGPKLMGLSLATCSADGIIRRKCHRYVSLYCLSICKSKLEDPAVRVDLARIYEAPDVINLAQWTLQHEIPTKVPLSCLSWNPSLSRAHPPMIAVGSDEASSGSVAGGAAASNSTSSSGRIFIYEYNEVVRRWARTDCLASVTDPVHDIVFAPNLGRSLHLLAVATKDVRIIALKPLVDNANSQNGGTTRYDTDVVAVFDDHYATVWRVSWNVTGTILASSGDDGHVRLWKMHLFNKWKCVAVLKGDGSCRIDPNGVSGSSSALTQSQPPATTRYYKLGNITNPNQVPWH